MLPGCTSTASLLPASSSLSTHIHRHTSGAARGAGGDGTATPRNWVHKKIPCCTVELNTQNCTWFGSQISLITKMSFREAICPLPRITHQGLCPWTPQGDFRSPDPLCPPLPNPGYATGLIRNDANIVSASKTQHWPYVARTVWKRPHPPQL